jgi:ABC-type dipeptide/oligopeptide/nickel transport system ATPase subunit
MLNVRNLSKTFNPGTNYELRIFNEFNLHINKGECTGILGANGCGKTTLFNIISGAIRQEKGLIILNGKNIDNLKENERARFIGRVHQNPSAGVSPSLTILENISLSANRPIKRFDIVDGVEKDASPTYVFKENGTKDFNYRQIEVADDPLEGTLIANVTWIDKSVPRVNVEFDDTLTNKDVEIKFTVIDGVSEKARLKSDAGVIPLTDKGNDRIGYSTVNKNGNYSFEVSNKYGNVGDIIVPIYNIDKEEPVLTLKGREHVYLKAGDKYYDNGAYAIDNFDGDITSGIKVDNNVITAVSSKTPYEVTYTISDKAGNTSTKTRYVHVLDIDSAVAIIQDTIIDLRSQDVHSIKIGESGLVYAEFIGIDGKFVTKYAKGEGFDNNYFKINGSYLSKLGTFTAQEGKYTLYVQDQERNTRIIKLNFYK